MLLFLAQAGLIAAHRVDLHRMTGSAGLILAPLMLAIGLAAAINSARQGLSPPGWDDRAWLAVPFISIGLFFGFFVAAIVNRRQAAFHKRFMLFATIAMLPPAMGRMLRFLDPPILPVGLAGALILLNLFLIALVIFDVRTTGRVHRATLWGVAIYLVTWPARFTIGYTEQWQVFARTLIA